MPGRKRSRRVSRRRSQRRSPRRRPSRRRSSRGRRYRGKGKPVYSPGTETQIGFSSQHPAAHHHNHDAIMRDVETKMNEATPLTQNIYNNVIAIVHHPPQDPLSLEIKQTVRANVQQLNTIWNHIIRILDLRVQTDDYDLRDSVLKAIDVTYKSYVKSVQAWNSYYFESELSLVSIATSDLEVTDRRTSPRRLDATGDDSTLAAVATPPPPPPSIR